MHTTRPWARVAYTTLAAALFALPASTQTRRENAPISQFLVQRAPAAEPQDDWSQEQLVELIERLEVGMSALEEVGAHDALRRVQEVAERLRRQREETRERWGEPDLSELGVRLEILHVARHACEEAGHERHVGFMSRVIRVAELQAEGAGEERIAQAMEGLSMGNVIEHLVHASQLWREFGHERKSRLCKLLAEYYAARDEGESEGEDAGHFEDLGQRLDVVRMARAAFAEIGYEAADHYLERWLHLGELQLEGAGEQRLAEASEGLSSERTVRLLHHAAEVLQERGRGERAHAVLSLAEFYAHRDGVGGEAEEHEGEEEHEHEGGGLEDRAHRLEIVELAVHAHAEAGHAEAAQFLRHFLHYGLLQERGASDEELARAAEGLSMEDAIEQIARASRLYAEWGNEERAHACGALAEFYARRLREGEGDAAEEHEHAEEHSGDDGGDEERRALQHRVEVIGLAHDAHARAGHRDRADLLERAAHVGHLVLEGVGEEELAHAAEGFSTEGLIGPLRSAAELYHEWGHHERARACVELAEYYRTRNAGGESGEREEREHAEGQELARRHLEELHHRMQQLHEEMEALRRHLAELTERLRR